MELAAALNGNRSGNNWLGYYFCIYFTLLIVCAYLFTFFAVWN